MSQIVLPRAHFVSPRQRWYPTGPGRACLYPHVVLVFTVPYVSQSQILLAI